MCLVDFFQEYEVVRKTPHRSDQPTHDFDDEEHPGFQKQVLRKRHPANQVLAQFSHWAFPDAASFGGNLFDLPDSQTNLHIEKFCQTVLILYHPFRVAEDLCINGSYHQKFLAIFPNKCLPPHIDSVLNNIQMYYNSMRLPSRDDPLKETTAPFSTCPSGLSADDGMDDDFDDTFAEGIFEFFNDGINPQPTESTNPSFSLFNLRKAGARRCGFENLPCMKPAGPASLTAVSPHETSYSSLLSFISVLPSSPPTVAAPCPSTIPSSKRDRPSLKSLMVLTCRAVKRRLDNNGSFVFTSQLDADGTAWSIVEWSQQPFLNFDPMQKLAFQIVTAAFVLTYYNDAQGMHPSQSTRTLFNSEKKDLQDLATLSRTKPHLRMFLDGPAGSGKSHVVRALLQYAAAYTTNLGLTFDMRTIVVTALSGVAATSIGGETLHSAAALNGSVDPERDQSWLNARLLIIDECSFMDTSQVATLDVRLRALMHLLD
jgi:hypothetical protein